MRRSDVPSGPNARRTFSRVGFRIRFDGFADAPVQSASLCRRARRAALAAGPGRDRRRACDERWRLPPLMRPTYPVTELLGDGIGPELSRAIHRLAEALPVRLDFVAVDFRLENRRAARQGDLRRGRRDDHRDPGRAQAPDDDRRGEPQRDPAAAARPLGHPSAGLHDSRRADQLPPRARPRHRADRHRRDLRRPRPDDRRGRRGQPADRRAAAGPRGGPLRVQPGPQDRQAGHQRLEVHDPEGDRRPLRAGRPGGRRAVPRSAALRRALRRTPGQGHHGRPRSFRSCWS